jgi:TonB-linked SusC/RagA family outer membrane protein
LEIALLVASVIVTRGALAQGTGSVGGTVVTTVSGAPIAGVEIGAGPTRGTVTSNAGSFVITGLAGDSVTLQLRHIGFEPVTQRVRIGDRNLRILMREAVVSLNQVIVTGTAGATERRAIGNAVATINAAQVTQIAPVANMQQLVNGRAPGVVVMPTSGAVGTGSQVRVRGIASFSLGNNPLLYVDGVRVDNAAASGPSNQAFGSSSISRLNDINPEEIQSIEILKGPSAATLYGTEASNGVINIITKHGTTGAPRWSAMLRQGVNYLQNWRTRFPTNYGVDPVTKKIVTVSMDSLIAANGGDIFRNGRDQAAELSVSGGTNLFNYFATGGVTDQQGAEPSNSTRKYNSRINMGLMPSSKLHLTLNAGYVTGPTNLSAEAGYGGRVWTTLLATPTTYDSPQHGYYSGIPTGYDQVYHMWQDLDRFTGSFQVEHTPISWFTHRLTFGIDRTSEGNNYYFPRNDSLNAIPSFSGDALGYREVDQATILYRSFDYAATATWHAMPSVSFATSAGAQYYRTRGDTLDAWGSVFPFPGLSTVSATTTSPGQAQYYSEDATLGYYGQEQFTWRDRLFLTAALRQDKSSAFGANFNKVTYPKYSLSYVVSDEPWWQQGYLGNWVNSFRIRAAYGEAGKAPGTYAALRTFAPVSGPGDQPAVTPQSIGNPNLGPERGKEYELGFDAGFLNDRAGIELTRYHKQTTNAILFKQIAPSVGFSGTEPFNAGGILNQGWELSVRATPIRREQLTWDVNFNYATNDNRVTSLFPGTNFVVAGTYLRQAVGFPAFAWFERKVTSAKLDSAGNAIQSSLMCADTVPGSNGRASSNSVPCYTNGKLTAPIVYLGRSVPPREGSFSTTLTFLKNFRVYTLIDFKNGQKKMDGNTRVRCTFFGGRCPENFFPLQSDPVRVAEVQSNRTFVDFLITNASFAKWRELTFSYDLPEVLTRQMRASHASFSISGRNLHTWTSYQGFEPEAMFLGGSRGGNAAWEQTTLPQLTSWLATLNLTF